MWKLYKDMNNCMPGAYMRMDDKRPKFPAFLLTYSQTKLDIDTVYKFLLGFSFPITEVVIEKHKDVGVHIHAFLGCSKGRTRRLSPDSLIVGGERPNI